MKLEKFYNYTSLIHSENEIKYLNNYYKQHFTKETSFSSFFAPIKKIAEKNPLIVKEIEKQFNQQKGLQGGILSEINIFSTVAQLMNITSFIDNNNQYQGENNNWSIILQGNLGHNNHDNAYDLLITDKTQKKTYLCEIKEPLARATDGDVRYDENGRIYKTSRQNIDLSAIQGFIDYYNKNITIFSHLGHNYQLKSSDCKALFINYFKNIDYVFTYAQDMLIVIPNDVQILSKVYSLKGSEIRGTGGKNPVNVFTPKYLNKTLKPFIIEETAENYTLSIGSHANEIHPVKGRGRSDITRYTIPYGFIVKTNDIIKQTETSIIVPKNKIKQLNANLSVHIHLLSDYEQIKNIILGG